MTRVIKFRAWDIKKNEMINWEELVGYCDIDYLFGGGHLRANKESSNFNYPIAMQFTGLLDKNGKEIYEGDIVSIIDCELSLYKVCYWGRFFKWGVECINPEDGDWVNESLEEFDSDQFEIIGNIYENGDLLK